MTSNIGTAVVERAIKDYRWSLIVLHYAEEHPNIKERPAYERAVDWKKECETFFKNQQLMDLYCDWDGIRIMHLIQQQVDDAIKSGKSIIIPDNAMMGVKLEFDSKNWD